MNLTEYDRRLGVVRRSFLDGLLDVDDAVHLFRVYTDDAADDLTESR